MSPVLTRDLTKQTDRVEQQQQQQQQQDNIIIIPSCTVSVGTTRALVTLPTEVSDRLLKCRVLARQYAYRPGIGSRRFAIVIKTMEMYSLAMHSVPL